MGNELKLSLENFQSISKGELIFHTGTNVIIGQSNSGKSATFRALKACLSNPAGSQRFIKKGTNSSSVMLEYNGNQIIWKRTPKESSYIINGETYLKTGKSNAFKLVENTGFAVDSNDTIMNIEEELQLPFPFGMSDSDLFKLYEDVFCVSDSAIILKSAKGVEDRAKVEIATIENDIVKNENKLKELKDFKEFVDINKLNIMKKTLTDRHNSVEALKDGLPTIKKALKAQEFSVKEATFSSLIPVYEDYLNLKRSIAQLRKLHVVSKNLKEVAFPQEVPLAQYKELRKLEKTSSIVSKLEELQVPVNSFEDKFKTYHELVNYLKNIEAIKNNIISKKKLLKETEERIQGIEEALKEFKVCPLCHKPLG